MSYQVETFGVGSKTGRLIIDTEKPFPSRRAAKKWAKAWRETYPGSTHVSKIVH